MSNRLFMHVLVLLLSVFCGLYSHESQVYAGDFSIITDMCGNRVEVPLNPERIACMHCVSSGKIMTLGRGDCIILLP